jgi:hypothetical protein
VEAERALKEEIASTGYNRAKIDKFFPDMRPEFIRKEQEDAANKAAAAGLPGGTPAAPGATPAAVPSATLDAAHAAAQKILQMPNVDPALRAKAEAVMSDINQRQQQQQTPPPLAIP